MLVSCLFENFVCIYACSCACACIRELLYLLAWNCVQFIFFNMNAKFLNGLSRECMHCACIPLKTSQKFAHNYIKKNNKLCTIPSKQINSNNAKTGANTYAANNTFIKKKPPKLHTMCSSGGFFFYECIVCCVCAKIFEF